MELGLRIFTKHPAQLIRNIIKPLSKQGIEVINHDAQINGPCIVFFDDVNGEITACIRQMSNGGLNRVLAISSQGSKLDQKEKWTILYAGASDVLTWKKNEILVAMITERVKRWSMVDEIVDSPTVRENLIGRSPAWLLLLRQVVEISRFTSDSVLLVGESGTGKELVARLVHKLQQQNNKGRLVLLDCSTIVPELSGSEFFGHERGAFTSAVSARDGAFALADSGTLFLDEVGELPIRLQTELLRVIQEGTYKRLGSNTWKKTRFRLVCATNRNLEREKNHGNFRSDLYYRLATWTFRLPPQKERKGDILPLAHYFLKNLCQGKDSPHLDKAVQDYLLSRQYPGNVRDLRRFIERVAARHVGPGPVTIGAIPEDERRANPFIAETWPDHQFESTIRCALLRGKGINEMCDATRETAYNIVLKEEQNDTDRSSRRLKISKRAVQMYLKNRRSGTGLTGSDTLCSAK
ncbi:MAG: AAA family ATPase [Phycisphaerae bacterium]|nr:sigma-54-dependent Fis family transcriptional regulator [Phycisphaerae bacterium]NIS54789.1 sigma-54-dependent Fis family transcriptional regulator [Phycisphaerae bacterium]NIV01220.1 AAA family ATPase [Phycisphaerae bacterium]NIV71119.1 AAA family ATPase [Phycisphaerae bacterium]NIX02674.1 AAA family ATPase [Phycisphaerae bacterium]